MLDNYRVAKNVGDGRKPAGTAVIERTARDIDVARTVADHLKQGRELLRRRGASAVGTLRLSGGARCVNHAGTPTIGLDLWLVFGAQELFF